MKQRTKYRATHHSVIDGSDVELLEMRDNYWVVRNDCNQIFKIRDVDQWVHVTVPVGPFDENGMAITDDDGPDHLVRFAQADEFRLTRFVDDRITYVVTIIGECSCECGEECEDPEDCTESYWMVEKCWNPTCGCTVWAVSPDSDVIDWMVSDAVHPASRFHLECQCCTPSYPESTNQLKYIDESDAEQLAYEHANSEEEEEEETL